MDTTSRDGLNSFVVEGCVALLNSDNCTRKVAEEGIALIELGCSRIMDIAKESEKTFLICLFL